MQYHAINPLSIPPAIVSCLSLVFALFLLSLGEKTKFNRLLFYINISLALGLSSFGLAINAVSTQAAYNWMRLHFVGIILLPAIIYHTAIVSLNLYSQKKNIAFLIYGMAVGLMVLLRHPLAFRGLGYFSWGRFPVGGIMPDMLLIFVFICFGLSLINLGRYKQLSRNRIENEQNKYLLLAFVCAFISYIDLLASRGFEGYPIGHLFKFYMLLVLAYMFVKCSQMEGQEKVRRLEAEIQQKSEEAAKAAEELNAAQLKMIETSKLSAVSSLGAGILHQLSQPITAIHGFVKFMKKEMKETDPFYKPVKLMEEQSVYIKDMLEDLMELIRHRTIEKKNININECITRVTNLLTDELRIRRIKWDLELGENLPQVFADAVHVQQIFMNIIVNAMQALVTLPKGSMRRLVIRSQYDEQEQQVVITFEDNGPGLSVEDQTQIFEPFFSTKTKGAGLGLALSKDLVAEHGGYLDAVNKPDAGAVFTVRFPVVSPEHDSQTRIEKL